MRISIFKCQWVRHPNDVLVEIFSFRSLDLTNVGHKDKPWVVAEHVAQVFYLIDLSF